MYDKYSHHYAQVCNHPELFERADVVAPFSFCTFGRSGPIMREGDFLILPYSTRSPIEYSVPLLLYQDGGMVDIPSEKSSSAAHSGCLSKLFNIWSTDWIHQSLYNEGSWSFFMVYENPELTYIRPESTSFSFLRFIDTPTAEAHQIHVFPLLRRRLIELAKTESSPDPYYAM